MSTTSSTTTTSSRRRGESGGFGGALWLRRLAHNCLFILVSAKKDEPKERRGECEILRAE